jgi:hypothetical protein
VITRFPAEVLMVAGVKYYTAGGPLSGTRETQSHKNLDYTGVEYGGAGLPDDGDGDRPAAPADGRGAQRKAGNARKSGKKQKTGARK